MVLTEHPCHPSPIPHPGPAAMISFAVSPVKTEHTPLTTVTPQAAVQALVGEGGQVIDAGARRPGVVSEGRHGLVYTVALSFGSHLPLILGPDEVWLAILQGYANHPWPEADDKVLLRVRRDDFLTLSPRPWPEVFDAFSAQIRDHIGGPFHDAFTGAFSTSGPL